RRRSKAEALSEKNSGRILPKTSPPSAFKPTDADTSLVRRYRDKRAAARPAPQIRIDKIKANAKGKTVSILLEPATGAHAEDLSAGAVAMARLANGFGVATFEAADRLLSHAMNATRTKDGTKEAEVNAALALIAGIAPRDEVEAMLAVQMTATHFLAMEL